VAKKGPGGSHGNTPYQMFQCPSLPFSVCVLVPRISRGTSTEYAANK